MNNGYQKSNGCGADKEGGEFFKTFFFTKLQSKHVRQLAYKGLLCDPCNYGLGFYEKHKDKYIEYLKKHD